ncbi:hypothetical protein CYMTET_44043 [Cymbomonas tetramitiformis]|uniref:RING-type domain-containing protein n=1 Tax=Cymbomonas tetramitiformis TaxID=36881 RepID=A0AAE0C265_9CHLO|nr:hypothetical protein CYMTET_44043 [Cymbomonas tetramitiformis]|eukprot:gene13688-16175_t
MQAQELTNFDDEELSESGIQCPVCLSFLCQPITLSCKHSFCRLCLLKSTRLSPDGRTCPMCRAAIEIRALPEQPVDAELDARVKQRVPCAIHAEREVTNAAEVEAYLKQQLHNLPVFAMYPGTKVGQHVQLHFFEPRYRVLIRRAWEGAKLFLYASETPREGRQAVVVQVVDAQFQMDGRCNIVGRAIEEVKMEQVWVEEGTCGLVYARCSHSGSSNADSPGRGVSAHSTSFRSSAEDFPSNPLPLFCLANEVGVGERSALTFFERRYLTLAQRILDADRAAEPLFLWGPSRHAGATATVVRVENWEMQEPGEVRVRLRGIYRATITSSEEDSEVPGLYYARVRRSSGVEHSTASISRRQTKKICVIQ